MLSVCILSSSDTISMVLIKVIFQIFLKRCYLYKKDTSLRRTLGHSPKVSVLGVSTVYDNRSAAESVAPHILILLDDQFFHLLLPYGLFCMYMVVVVGYHLCVHFVVFV